jgi:hypothetical protein
MAREIARACAATQPARFRHLWRKSGRVVSCAPAVVAKEEDYMSSQFGFWPFPWPNLVPSNLTQPILPDWSLQHITVNYQGNPAIEKDVSAKVASYGKQLGIITEAVLALADGGPDKSDRIERLRDIAKRIEKIKEEHRSDLAASAQQAMESLARKDSAAAARIGAKFANERGSDSGT